ncbi:hypothetical protein BGX38DRAFT_1333746 [Terfezia claveryi]|nr:hypothetical protein BGX38DRAFT_1333746 [Terfezia claveryi]
MTKTMVTITRVGRESVRLSKQERREITMNNKDNNEIRRGVEMADRTVQASPVKDASMELIIMVVEVAEVGELEQAIERKRRRKDKEKGKGKERAKDSMPAGDLHNLPKRFKRMKKCSMREGYLLMRTYLITRRN